MKLADRGISEGKWNAVGGKVDFGETPLECVKREVLEEAGLRINEPFYHGKVKFFFGNDVKSNSYKTWIVHIFSTDRFTGELKESEEGRLRWFGIDEIPFDKMWHDDEHWVPLMLAGKRFYGEFFFSEDGKELQRHELKSKN